MDIKIRDKIENKLYNRVELILIIEHPGEATPKRDDIKSRVAAMFNHNEKLVVVKKILTEFGKNRSIAKVYLYNEEKDMMRIEPKYILKRNKILQ